MFWQQTSVNTKENLFNLFDIQIENRAKEFWLINLISVFFKKKTKFIIKIVIEIKLVKSN